MPLPDGPPDGFLHRFYQEQMILLQPFRFLVQCQQRYGDAIVIKRNSAAPVVYFSHPQAVKQIFSADPGLFARRSKSQFVKTLMGPTSVFTSEGNDHRRLRRVLMPPLVSECMANYGRLMQQVTREVLSQCPTQQPIVIRHYLHEISLRIMIGCLFGLTEESELEQLKQILEEMINACGTPQFSLFLMFYQLQVLPATPWKKYLRLLEKVDRRIYQMIAERRQCASQTPDILSILINTRDSDGQPLSDLEIRDELMTLLFTGTDTVVSGLAWSVFYLSQHPDVQEKLQQELTNSGAEQPEQFNQLPYLTAVTQEVLRISPIAFFTTPRILKAPLEVQDHTYPAGYVLIPAIYLVHHRPDLYPQPEQFRPERFLERQFSPYEFFPFGGGHRFCLGMAVAQLQIKVVLAELMQQFSVRVLQPESVQPKWRLITFAPPEHMRAELVP